MPRISRSVPKYRKHRHSGQAIVTINARDYYLGPHGTVASHAEYDRLISEWLASGRSATYGVATEELTVVELLAAYVKYARHYYGPGPRGEYANMKRAIKPVKELYGRRPAASFGPSELKAVRQRLVDGGGARTYVNAVVRRIVRVFRWAASEALVPPAVPLALAMVPGLRKGRTDAREPDPVHPVDAQLVEATLPHLSPIVASMVRLQMLTGARPGEICRLCPRHIDRRGEVWIARLDEHKTAHHGRQRTIFIGPQGQRVLAPFLLRAADAPCFSPAEATAWTRSQRTSSRQTPLSCGNRVGTNRKRDPRRQSGTKYTTESYYYAVRRACKKAGIKTWSPGQLRHTAGTEIRRRYGLEAAQVILGHAQLGTTQVYAERDLALGIQVALQAG